MPSSSRRSPTTQRGAALVAVLLLGTVIILATLLFSMGTGTELKIAHNDVLGRQALAVAEAGISHAMSAVTPSAADELGMDEELTDPPTGGLLGFPIAVAIVEDGVTFNYLCVDVTGSVGGRYCLRAFDNFDETSGADAPLDDIDESIILRSRGTVGTATRVVDAMVSVFSGPDCTIITDGNLDITDNPSVTGTMGCVHANADLTVSGDPIIEHGATASATMTISGTPVMEGVALTTSGLKDGYEADNENQPPMFIPSIRPMSFGSTGLQLHNYVMNHPQGFRLDADANIYVGPGYAGPGGPGGAWTCGENPPNCTGGRALTGAEITAAGLDSFRHESQSWSPPAQWVSDKDWCVPGVYFVEGSVILSKDWGAIPACATPWRATIIALNSIQMQGKPIMTSYHQTADPVGPGYVTTGSPAAEWALRNVLMVSGNDLEINGDPDQDNFAGGFLAHQQIKISGNPEIVGFLIAEDGATTWAGDPAPNCNSESNLLCDPGNSISGNPDIHFDGFGTSLFPIRITRSSWNDVR